MFCLGVTLLLASLVTIIAAGSRTAIAALTASACVTSIVAYHNQIHNLLQYLVQNKLIVKAVTMKVSTIKVVTTTVCVAAVFTVSVIASQALWNTFAFWRTFTELDFFATLIQRSAMWKLLWGYILEKPISGYGFFAFWDASELTATHELLGKGSAHNSLIETALGLGLLGVIPFILIVVKAASNSLLCLWRQPNSQNWVWATVVLFLLITNITESFVLWFSYNWVLLMAAAMRQPDNPIQQPDNTVSL